MEAHRSSSEWIVLFSSASSSVATYILASSVFVNELLGPCIFVLVVSGVFLCVFYLFIFNFIFSIYIHISV